MTKLRVLAAAVCLFLAGLGLACDAAAQVRDPYGVAVIIGNRDYGEPGLSNVDYAVRDARAFERYVLDVLGLDPKNVLVLENATRRQMSKAFGRPGDPPGGPSDLWALLDTAGRSDVSVFYSGHGVPGLDDGKGYLLPVDVPARFAQDEGYPIAALYERLAALRAAAGAFGEVGSGVSRRLLLRSEPGWFGVCGRVSGLSDRCASRGCGGRGGGVVGGGRE